MIVTKNLIDVANPNGVIDWKKVSATGIDGAIIRAGYRGYGTAGTLATDKSFVRNITGAIAVGLPVGIYWLSQALSDAEAVAEAKYLLGLLEPYRARLVYPVFLDSEYGEGQHATGRADKLPKQLRTQYGLTFLRTLKGAGYETGLYCSENWFSEFIDGEAFRDSGHKIWIANISKKPTIPHDAWQHSWKGRVDGISSEVDLDYFYVADEDRTARLERQITALTEEIGVLKEKLERIRTILK